MTDGNLYVPDAMADRTVFVAGGSSGINLGIAQRFAELGANVSLISRDAEKVEAAAATMPGAMGISADVRDYDAVADAIAATADRFGAIDVVISGAAGNFPAPVIGTSPNAFRTVVEIDLIGTFNVFRASFDHLRRPGASLIAITAGQGRRAMMFQSHACAAKAGVDLLTQTLAMEWGPAGVRVNAIAPGPIAETEGMARLAPTPEAVARIKSALPLRDFGTKRNVADMAVFLASDAASYVTGSIMDCDGGAILGDASADALNVKPRTKAR